MKRFAIATLGLTLACTLSAVARAGDPAAADALFREGRDAAKRGDYASACPKFAESQRLDPAAGTLINLAECEAKLGKLATALGHYRDAIDALPPGDDRMPIVKREAASLEKRVPTLTIELASGVPDGTKVRRDSVELRAASLGTSLPVDPGEHEIVVTAPGRQDTRVVAKVREGQAKTVSVDVGDVAPEASTESTRHEAGERRDAESVADPGNGTRTLGYVVAGIGVAGVVFGAASLYQAHGAKSMSDDDYDAGNAEQGAADYRLAQRWQTGSVVSFVLGGAALGTGAVLVLTAPRATAASMRIAPVVGERVAGVSVAGSW